MASATEALATDGRSEVLDSWKEIAAFLQRGIRTVQRWERTEGLPVRRHAHLKRGSVYALRSEVALWFRARQFPPKEEPRQDLHGHNQLNGHIARQKALMGEVQLQLKRLQVTQAQMIRPSRTPAA